jgi:hypothetical protein
MNCKSGLRFLEGTKAYFGVGVAATVPPCGLLETICPMPFGRD